MRASSAATVTNTAAAEAEKLRTRDPERRRAEPIMGTVVSLFTPNRGARSAGADACFAWLHEAERRFSPFRPDSEVAALMRGVVPAAGASADLREVLELCEVLADLSGGAFDMRAHRPDGAADPTGLVKGWATDRAARILEEHGIGSFCLSAGGDVVVRGGRGPQEPWRVGIADPRVSGRVALTLRAMDLAVATSGSAERGQHIVDGRTGRRPEGVLSLSVAGPSLAHADGYATAAFAMGAEGLGWCARLPAYEGCAISTDGRLAVTAGLGRYLAAPPG